MRFLTAEGVNGVHDAPREPATAVFGLGVDVVDEGQPRAGVPWDQAATE